MRATTLSTKTVRKGMLIAFNSLVILIILACAFWSSKAYSSNSTTANCSDCGIYESVCKGKVVHWYILDNNGWFVRGDPRNLLRSTQAREFIDSVKKKYPGKVHSKEICEDNQLA